MNDVTTSTANGSRGSSRFQKLYQDGAVRLQARVVAQRTAEELRIRNELEKCTFRPVTTSLKAVRTQSAPSSTNALALREADHVSRAVSRMRTAYSMRLGSIETMSKPLRAPVTSPSMPSKKQPSRRPSSKVVIVEVTAGDDSGSPCILGSIRLSSDTDIQRAADDFEKGHRLSAGQKERLVARLQGVKKAEFEVT